MTGFHCIQVTDAEEMEWLFNGPIRSKDLKVETVFRQQTCKYAGNLFGRIQKLEARENAAGPGNLNIEIDSACQSDPLDLIAHQRLIKTHFGAIRGKIENYTIDSVLLFRLI